MSGQERDEEHIADIAAVLGEVLERDDDPEDEETLCASFHLPDSETPWVQVIPGTLNTHWPFAENDDPAPLARLRAAVPSLPEGVEVEHVEPGLNAEFAVPETVTPEEMAVVVDELFRGLHGLSEDYDLEAHVFALALAIPEPVPIAHEEPHTSRIGSYDDGQFMGFVVAHLPESPPDDWASVKRWFAVLHRFNGEGVHRDTRAECLGTSADGEDEVIGRARTRLDEWIGELGSVEYGDVEVNLFEAEIDGAVFGLVDTTWEDEEEGAVIVEATLVPNDLVFTEPWDGTYDT